MQWSLKVKNQRSFKLTQFSLMQTGAQGQGGPPMTRNLQGGGIAWVWRGTLAPGPCGGVRLCGVGGFDRSNACDSALAFFAQGGRGRGEMGLCGCFAAHNPRRTAELTLSQGTHLRWYVHLVSESACAHHASFRIPFRRANHSATPTFLCLGQTRQLLRRRARTRAIRVRLSISLAISLAISLVLARLLVLVLVLVVFALVRRSPRCPCRVAFSGVSERDSPAKSS